MCPLPKNGLCPLLLLMLLSLLATPGWTAEFDHSVWDRLLKTQVRVLNGGQTTQVDYDGMAREQPRLDAYLDDLAAVSQEDFDQWPIAEQLAFLINAYNAWTLELILRAWPDITSIKEQGSLFRSPWSRHFIPLLGETRSLDEIEHEMIRGSERYREPRIHFAVNCASIGCPALRAEAYTDARLEFQLEEQTRLFLSDRSRNRWHNGALQISSIFKWYREDFTSGWRGADSLAQFLVLYAQALGLNESERRQLLAGEVELEFLDYDWGLNATPRAGASPRASQLGRPRPAGRHNTETAEKTS